jgi:hypothetical protein
MLIKGVPLAAGWAALVAAVVMAVPNLIILRRIAGITLGTIRMRVWRPTLACCVMASVVQSVDELLQLPGSSGASLIRLIALVIVGAIAYCGSLACFWHFSGRPDGPEAYTLSKVRSLLSWIAAKRSQRR